jgi:esterase/lipase superfamily enzyme
MRSNAASSVNPIAAKEISMLFVANRVFHQGQHTVPGRDVTFDLDDNNALQSVFFCSRTDSPDLDAAGRPVYKEIGSTAFLNRLRASKAEQILFYIHGYSNLPEDDIFPRATKLGKACVEAGLNIEIVPIIWPCDNDSGIIQDYYDDQVAADASSTAFSRALSKFMAWQEKSDDAPCLKRINVLSHSMGNRVLRGALLDWATSLSGRIPFVFRNIFMAAADVVNETLQKDKDGAFICQSSRNVVVYYASDDLALRSSKIANVRNNIASRRLGHTGPEDMAGVPDNVFSIDCDDVNTLYDMPKGHSYFIDSQRERGGAVFRHIVSCLRTGRVPADQARRLIIEDDSFL